MFCSKGVLSDTEILLAVRWMGALLWVVGDGGLDNESSGLRGPMLMLMVSYTMLSLWILAQPIIEPAIK